MSRPIYSTWFITEKSQTPLSGGLSYSPPLGQVAVVRDVTLFARLFLVGASAGLVDDAGTEFVNYTIIDPLVQQPYYHWEGRQVFVHGQTFSTVVGLYSWDIRVSGYLLNA